MIGKHSEVLSKSDFFPVRVQFYLGAIAVWEIRLSRPSGQPSEGGRIDVVL